MLCFVCTCTAGLVLVLLLKGYGVKRPILLVVILQLLDYITTDAVYLGTIIFTLQRLYLSYQLQARCTSWTNWRTKFLSRGLYTKLNSERIYLLHWLICLILLVQIQLFGHKVTQLALLSTWVLFRSFSSFKNSSYNRSLVCVISKALFSLSLSVYEVFKKFF